MRLSIYTTIPKCPVRVMGSSADFKSHIFIVLSELADTILFLLFGENYTEF